MAYKSASKLDMIYEDKDIFVVVKPQNIPVQSDKSASLTLMNLIEDYFEFSRGIDMPFIGLIHRLDRHTGGVCVFAKNKASLAAMNQRFSSRQVEKRYLAVVTGEIPPSGTLEHYLEIHQKTNFVKAYDSPPPSHLSSLKRARLHYTRLHVMKSATETLSLVEVRLDTGRQHQIRVQLATIGHPVSGDAKYGNPVDKGDSLALWAYKLAYDDKCFISLPSLENRYFKPFEDFFNSNQFRGILSSSYECTK